MPSVLPVRLFLFLRLHRRPRSARPVWQLPAGIAAFLLSCGAYAAPLAAPATPSSGANAVTQAEVRLGALSCASRINQVTNFLGADNALGTVLFPPPGQPDQRLATVSMNVKGVGANTYVSASFAPNQANGCGAVYDAVTWWPETCAAVGSRHFAALKKISGDAGAMTVLDGGIATKVFLMPAGSGCVSIKKEVVL